jgi:hypothetical protein
MNITTTTITFDPLAQETEIVEAIDRIWHQDFGLTPYRQSADLLDIIHHEDDIDFVQYLIESANRNAGYDLVKVVG